MLEVPALPGGVSAGCHFHLRKETGGFSAACLLFCGAPHLFIAHEKCVGKWAEDSKTNCHLAAAYFELLCNAHGLGTTIMSYSAEVLNELAPEARAMLNIPKDHYTGLIIGFGYPEIKYARGVQKGRSAKTHRYTEEKR